MHSHTVTTFLENLEMSGNFAVVREMSANWLFGVGIVRRMSGKNLVRENCFLVV